MPVQQVDLLQLAAGGDLGIRGGQAERIAADGEPGAEVTPRADELEGCSSAAVWGLRCHQRVSVGVQSGDGSGGNGFGLVTS